MYRTKHALVGAVALATVTVLAVISPALAGPPTPPGGGEPGTGPTTPPPREQAYGSLPALVSAVGNTTGNCPPGGSGRSILGTGGVTPQPGQRVVRISVIGDSYMSGEGAGDYLNAKGMLVPPLVPVSGGVAPAPGYTMDDYKIDWRHRSANAPALLAIEQLRRANPDVGFDVQFGASSGAETRHYFEGQNDNNRVNPPQSGVITKQTDLVIMGFGGNDAGFGPIVEKALLGMDVAALSRLFMDRTRITVDRHEDVEWSDSLGSTPYSLVSRYIRIVRDIHTRQGGPNTRVMMVTYPQGLGAQHPNGPMGALLNEHEADILRELAAPMAWSMRRAQQIMVNHSLQVDLLDIQNAFRNHPIGSADPFVNNLTIEPGPTAFNAIQQTAHPNVRGAQALATYYAGMIAHEVGVRPPATGLLPIPLATRPCQWPMQPTPEPPVRGTPGNGATGQGAGGGSSGSRPSTGTPGVDDPVAPPNPHAQPWNPSEAHAPYGDISPVDPVRPNDPSVPDGLVGQLPNLPVSEPEYPGPGLGTIPSKPDYWDSTVNNPYATY